MSTNFEETNFEELCAQAQDVEAKIKSADEEYKKILKDLTSDEAEKSQARLKPAFTEAVDDLGERAQFKHSWKRYIRDLWNGIQAKEIYLQALKDEIGVLRAAKDSQGL